MTSIWYNKNINKDSIQAIMQQILDAKHSLETYTIYIVKVCTDYLILRKNNASDKVILSNPF